MTTKQRIENKFICAYCNKTYVRKSSYNTHLVKCKLCRFASDCGNIKSVNNINFTNSSSEHVNTESTANDSVNIGSANNANSSNNASGSSTVTITQSNDGALQISTVENGSGAGSNNQATNQSTNAQQQQQQQQQLQNVSQQITIAGIFKPCYLKV